MDNHRKYCNYIKNLLLEDAIKNINEDPKDSMLLDLCSGRGGDMFKWNKLCIGRVYGIDSDKASFLEAINRYIKNKKQLKSTKISFFNFSVTDCDRMDAIIEGKKMSIVSCMFGLHYFTYSYIILDNVIRSISNNLKKGGLFIGIAPDELYLKKLLNPDDAYSNDDVIIEYDPSWYNSYKFLIKSNKEDDYFSFKGISSEFFIDKELFKKICMKYDLVMNNKFNRYRFPNLYDTYPENNYKNTISQLYFSFCFVKI